MKTRNPRFKSLLKVALPIVLTTLVVGTVAAYAVSGMQSCIAIANPDADTGMQPLGGEPFFISFAPQLKFKFDTGADISSITDADLQWLEDNGYSVQKTWHPTIGRDGRGDMVLETVRYRVTIPMYSYSAVVNDSTVNPGWTTEPVNQLINVDFIPSRIGASVIGIDVLEKFAILLNYKTRQVSILPHRPADGFERLVQLRPQALNPLVSMLPGTRYEVPFQVQGKEYNFFMDTGIRREAVKLPNDQIRWSNGRLFDDTVVNYRGRYPAHINNDAWTVVGDRAGARRASFYDSDEEPYAFNPLNMFNQDFLIDFTEGYIYLRPTYDMAR